MTFKKLHLLIVAATAILTSTFASAQTIISFSDATRLNNRTDDTNGWRFATNVAIPSLLVGDASDSVTTFEVATTFSLSGYTLDIATAQSIVLTFSYEEILDDGPGTFSIYGFELADPTIFNGTASDFHDNGLAGTLVSTTSVASLPSAPGTVSFDVTALLKGFTPESTAAFLITSPLANAPNGDGADAVNFYTTAELSGLPNNGHFLTITPVPEASSALLVGGTLLLVTGIRRRRSVRP